MENNSAMKKSFLFVIAAIFISATQLKAQDYKTALGIRLSSRGPAVNNSLSFKHFLLGWRYFPGHLSGFPE